MQHWSNHEWRKWHEKAKILSEKETKEEESVHVGKALIIIGGIIRE